MTKRTIVRASWRGCPLLGFRLEGSELSEHCLIADVPFYSACPIEARKTRSIGRADLAGIYCPGADIR